MTWVSRLPTVAFELVTAVALASLVAWATYSSDEASGPWESATRQEARWSVAAVEVVRHVYQDQAPIAFQLSLAERRLQALVDSGAPAQRVQGREAANDALRTAAGDDSAVQERYRTAAGGYDLVARLADVRDADADLKARTVTDELAEGDRLHERARLLSLACVPVLFVFVLVTVARRRHARRAATAAAGGARGVDPPRGRGSTVLTPAPSEDVDIIVDPFDGAGRTTTAAWLIFATWVLLVVAPLLQVEVAARADREDATATRLVSEIARDVLASQLHAGLDGQARQAVVSASSEIVGSGLTTDEDFEIATAEVDAIDGWAPVAAEMTREPMTADGVDAELVEAIRSTPSDHDELREEQNAAFDDAADLSAAGRWLTLCLVLAAFATTAASLAHRRGRQGVVARLAGVGLILGSLTALLVGLGTAAT